MLNHITIMGRMTKDPELRYTAQKTPVASFTVAVDRDVADRNGNRETDFIDCVAWRGAAEFVSKYFSKGSMIVVAGRLQLRDWTDKDGIKRRNAEILVENIYFGESKKNEPEKPRRDLSEIKNRYPEAVRTTGAFSDLDEEDGDLPF